VLFTLGLMLGKCCHFDVHTRRDAGKMLPFWFGLSFFLSVLGVDRGVAACPPHSITTFLPQHPTHTHNDCNQPHHTHPVTGTCVST
jgi:hypothetical protein